MAHLPGAWTLSAGDRLATFADDVRWKRPDPVTNTLSDPISADESYYNGVAPLNKVVHTTCIAKQNASDLHSAPTGAPFSVEELRFFSRSLATLVSHRSSAFNPTRPSAAHLAINFSENARFEIQFICPRTDEYIWRARDEAKRNEF